MLKTTSGSRGRNHRPITFLAMHRRTNGNICISVICHPFLFSFQVIITLGCPSHSLQKKLTQSSLKVKFTTMDSNLIIDKEQQTSHITLQWYDMAHWLCFWNHPKTNEDNCSYLLKQVQVQASHFYPISF